MVRALDRHIRSEESRVAFEADVVRCQCGRKILPTESQCGKCHAQKNEGSSMNKHTSDLFFCHQLGNRGYRPFNRMETNAGELEFVSYPFPEKGNIFINARTVVGDATSMRKFQFVRGDLVEVPL